MTHDELIEAVAEELAEELGIKSWADTAEDRGHLRSLVRAGANYDVNEPTKMDLRDLARAAIRVIAPAVLDEAAKFLEQETQYWPDPAYGSMLAYVQAIRALKTRYEV